MKKLLLISAITLLIVIGCREKEDTTSEVNRQPKTSYGQAVENARKASGKTSQHDREVAEQAEELGRDK